MRIPTVRSISCCCCSGDQFRIVPAASAIFTSISPVTRPIIPINERRIEWERRFDRMAAYLDATKPKDPKP